MKYSEAKPLRVTKIRTAQRTLSRATLIEGEIICPNCHIDLVFGSLIHTRSTVQTCPSGAMDFLILSPQAQQDAAA